jgi:hypothetical protein
VGSTESKAFGDTNLWICPFGQARLVDELGINQPLAEWQASLVIASFNCYNIIKRKDGYESRIHISNCYDRFEHRLCDMLCVSDQLANDDILGFSCCPYVVCDIRKINLTAVYFML